MFFIYSKKATAEKPTDVRPYQKKSSYIFREDVSVAEAAELVGKGHAWRAGAYASGEGTFKKAEVLGSEIIALDFDSCPFAPESVVEYGESVGFRPNFYYYSYSHGIKPQFNYRVVWVLESGITPKAYEECYRTILEVFKQFGPDGATKDCSRLWFGGKDVKLVCEEPISLSSIGWLTIVNKAKEGARIRSALNGKKGCLEDYAALAYPDTVYVNTTKKWWLCLAGVCPLWDKFAAGEYLDYNQRLTLFTNLKYIKYSDNTTSIIDDIMTFYNEEAYRGHTFNREQLLQMMNSQVLRPVPIVKNLSKNLPKIPSLRYIEYHNNGENGKNLSEKATLTVPDYLRLVYTDFTPEIENNSERISVEEMTQIMADVIPKEIETGGIKYFISPTASGKTEHIINWLKKQDLTTTKIVVAQPRHDLIDEFMERLAKTGLTMDNAPVYRVFKRQYDDGALMRLKLGLPSGIYDKQRSDTLRLLKNPDAKGLFVITHSMLVKIEGGEGVDYYFIDENIEQALVDNINITAEQVEQFSLYVPEEHKPKMLALAKEIEEAQPGDLVGIKALIKAAADMPSTSREKYSRGTSTKLLIEGLFRLRDTDLLSKNRHDKIFLKKPCAFFTNLLTTKANIMMLTATPMREILNTLYPDAGAYIRFFTVPTAKNEGRIIQYMGATGARGINNSRVPDLINYIKSKHIGEDLSQYTVLTFKGAEQGFKDAGFNIEENELFNIEDTTIDSGSPVLHIANCAGLDRLKGKKIIIAGKYDYPQEEYEDYYYTINHRAKDIPTRAWTNITVNNQVFKVYLYQDPHLQQIQRETLEFYTSQAAGRARALREQSGYVEVFCDYPLKEADRYVLQ